VLCSLIVEVWWTKQFRGYCTLSHEENWTRKGTVDSAKCFFEWRNKSKIQPVDVVPEAEGQRNFHQRFLKIVFWSLFVFLIFLKVKYLFCGLIYFSFHSASQMPLIPKFFFITSCFVFFHVFPTFILVEQENELISVRSQLELTSNENKFLKESNQSLKQTATDLHVKLNELQEKMNKVRSCLLQQFLWVQLTANLKTVFYFRASFTCTC